MRKKDILCKSYVALSVSLTNKFLRPASDMSKDIILLGADHKLSIMTDVASKEASRLVCKLVRIFLVSF